MLPVTFFIAFWAVLAFGAFFIAIRGGLGGARETFQVHARRPGKTAGVLFAVIFVGFGIVLPVTFLTGNRANASGQIGGIRLNAAAKQGRQQFSEHCSVCHTLAAANAVGKTGPNLDTIQPSYSLVVHTVTYGCLQNPTPASVQETCLGEGTMPADIIQGKQLQEVAAFVATVAGKE